MPESLNASLILCNVPSVNLEAAQTFYGTLLGVDFSRAPNNEVESLFAPISDDGIDLTITSRYDDQERVTCYFAVADLDSAISALADLGGRIVVEPRPVAMSEQAREAFKQGANGGEIGDTLGTVAVLLDPDGNHVGVMQLEEFAQPYFRVGSYQRAIGSDRLSSRGGQKG